MMKHFAYLVLFFLIVPCFSIAQSPHQMSFQFIVRDGNGALISESPVGIRISLLQGSESGEAVYVETHNTTTNINGAGSLKVGLGNVVEGSFAHINWSQGPYFIQTETDPNGGSNYSVVGVSQVLSVPYALYAENGYFYKIGDLAEGGIIFSLWKDADGQEHGLVASVEDMSNASTWGPLYEDNEAASCENGSLNNGAVPGDLCEDYNYTDPNTGITYDDYYLPAIWELNALAREAYIINDVLNSDGDPETTGLASGIDSNYWSSTELNSSFAWFVQFGPGVASSNFKDMAYKIRAVRRF